MKRSISYKDIKGIESNPKIKFRCLFIKLDVNNKTFDFILGARAWATKVQICGNVMQLYIYFFLFFSNLLFFCSTFKFFSHKEFLYI